MTTGELLNLRKERLRKAIALEKSDKTPMVIMADGFFARMQGVTLADFCSSFDRANEVMLAGMKELGNLEGATACFSAASVFPLIFMTHVKLPGKELPVDSLWQLDEKEMITHADYDTILKGGWMPFMGDFLINRLKFDLPGTLAALGETPRLIKNFEDAGYLVYSPLVSTCVPELIAGGRSMPQFTRDMYKMPDKLEAVLDQIQSEMLPMLREQIRATKAEIVFMSPARGASEFYSPKLWEKFVWKYLKQTADVILEEGANVDFHIDSNWERDLDFFKSMPARRCIFESDGVTNHHKFMEKLGDRMAFKGDVPSAMLAVGNPDEVYKYVVDLKKTVGNGLIVSCGCSCPPNAKIENVKAMIAAAAEN
jgi:uroporphyrinogen-III decarboxylase